MLEYICVLEHRIDILWITDEYDRIARVLI